MMERKRSFTIVEVLTAVCVIFVFLGVFAIYAKATLRAGRETALREELNNIRTSIKHYHMIRGKLPEDLLILMKQEFTFRRSDGIVISRPYLEPFRMDGKGNLLDPFLKKYVYDRETGQVATSSKTYQSW